MYPTILWLSEYLKDQREEIGHLTQLEKRPSRAFLNNCDQVKFRGKEGHIYIYYNQEVRHPWLALLNTHR